jgi:hypothetical protein
MFPERLGGRAGEPDEGGIDAVGARVGRQEPEDGISSLERLVDGGGGAVRALDDLDAFASVLSQRRRVTRDESERFAADQEVCHDLAADEAGGCGDHDHRFLLLLTVAMIHSYLYLGYRTRDTLHQ